MVQEPVEDDGGEDRGPQVDLELTGEAAGGFGCAEPADRVVQGGEVDRVTGLAGGDCRRDSEHGSDDRDDAPLTLPPAGDRHPGMPTAYVVLTAATGIPVHRPGASGVSWPLYWQQVGPPL